MNIILGLQKNKANGLKCIYILLVSLLTAAPLSATPILKSQVYNYQSQGEGWGFNYSIGGLMYEDKNNSSSNTINLGLGAVYKHNFSNHLTTLSDIGISLATGNVQDTINESGGNSIKLNNAYLRYTKSFYDLSAGAHSQSFLKAPLLIDGTAFPGFIERFYLGEKLKLEFQQSMPVSKTFSSEVIEKEKTPAFLTESLTFEDRFNIATYNLKATYFAFYQLPSKVATESGRAGNDVVYINELESKFVHPFQGYHLDARIELDHKYSITTYYKYSYLKNSFAEASGEDKATAQQIEIGTNFWTHQNKHSISLSKFRSGANSTPAFYGTMLYVNYEGIRLNYESTFPEMGLKIGSDYVQANVINANPTQADANAISIYVEVVQ